MASVAHCRAADTGIHPQASNAVFPVVLEGIAGYLVGPKDTVAFRAAQTRSGKAGSDLVRKVEMLGLSSANMLVASRYVSA